MVQKKKFTEEQKKSNTILLFYGKCGCGWLVTDYPFMNCTTCGYIGSGSAKELDKATKKGQVIHWKIEPPEGIPSSEIRDRTIHGAYDDYMDYLDD